MRSITIINNKGGVLKTTIATNLAYTAALHGKKVLLVDTDPQGSASQRFGFGPQSHELSLADVIEGSTSITETLLNVNEKKQLKGELHILPSTFAVSLIEMKIGNGKLKNNVVDKAFEKILSHAKSFEYDLIIFDAAPTFGRITKSLMKYTSDVLIPVKPEKDAVYGMRTTVTLLANDGYINKVKYVIPTLTNMRTRLHKAILRDMIQPVVNQTKAKLLQDISYSVTTSTIENTSNLPVSAYSKNIKAKQTYKAIAKAIGII